MVEVRDPSFAPPAHKLAGTGALPGPNVTAAPAGGQAFALEPDGTIPASLQSSPITGQIASGGTVTAGTGWSVNRSGTGIYDVTFDSAFAATPTIVASPIDVSARLVKIDSPTTAGFSIFTYTTGGAAANGGSHFLAFETV